MDKGFLKEMDAIDFEAEQMAYRTRLRDEFAMAAFNILKDDRDLCLDYYDLAVSAYKIADAMMKVREAKNAD